MAQDDAATATATVGKVSTSIRSAKFNGGKHELQVRWDGMCST